MHYQPITITCLEEYREEAPYLRYQYGICEGDHIEQVVQLPAGFDSIYNNITCPFLQNSSIDNSSISNFVSEDCVFTFDVKEEKDSHPRINYKTKLQLVGIGNLIELDWFFSFYYKEDCPIISSSVFDNFQWLNNQIDQNICNGETIIVYNDGTYDFIVIEYKDGGARIYETTGTFYFYSPTGFDYLHNNDAYKMVERWTCNKVRQSKYNKRKIQNTDFQIFPNPATDKLFINLQELTFEQPIISIYDVQGRQVKQLTSEEAFAGIVQMDVRDLESGIYLVEVRTSENILTEKILIK